MNRISNLIFGIVLLVLAALIVVLMFVNPPTTIWAAWYKGFAVGFDVMASAKLFCDYFLG